VEQFESLTLSERSSSSDSDSSGLLTMNLIRFNSCSILPSQLESCGIERHNQTK